MVIQNNKPNIRQNRSAKITELARLGGGMAGEMTDKVFEMPGKVRELFSFSLVKIA
jgi:hypothetical protein